MNLFNIIEEIEKIDPEVSDRMSPRRAAIKNITSFGSKVAAAALPFALGTMFKKAYGQSNPTEVIAVLNFALTLEHLEADFYNKGGDKAGLIDAADYSSYFEKVRNDENAHVTVLTNTIKSLGGTPVKAEDFRFDLTGGAFPDVLSNYDTFLKVGVAFEDTGVRAYKGQAPKLLGNEVILGAALAIHAVEARHAAAIRYVINKRLNLNLKPWITSTETLGNDTGIPQVSFNYAGEQNVIQLGVVDITKLPKTGTSTSIGSATAAFDEPLTMQATLDLLINKFIFPK